MVNIIISKFFYINDSYFSKTTSIPCKNIDVAKAIAQKLYKEYAWYDYYPDEEGEFELYQDKTQWNNDKGWCVRDCKNDFIECKIVESNLVEDSNSFKFDWSKVSLDWDHWYEDIKEY